MDSYLVMRKRFANNFRQIVEFGLGNTRNPRCLRISSALLLNASSVVLDEFVQDVDFRIRSAAENKVEVPKMTPAKYGAFLQSLGNLVTGLNSFFDSEIEPGEDVAIVVDVLKTLSDVLKNIEKVSGLMVEQDGLQYWLFSDEKIQKLTGKFLSTIEIRDVLSGLKNKYVQEALKESGDSDVSRSIPSSFRGILSNIKDGNSDLERKLRNNKKTPLLDASKPYKVLHYKAASEEKTA